MDSPWFAPPAEVLATDRTVVTTDPRRIYRNSIDDVHATFLAAGQGPAREKFGAAGGFAGEDEGPQRPPEADLGAMEANGAHMLGHMLRPTTRYEPDIAR
jgi:hypothetical protein